MPNGDKPNSYLQESILSLLCYSDDDGKVIRNIVKPELFEGDYRVLAERALNYWQAHNQAPKVHTSELLSDILTDPGNRRAATFRRILINLSDLYNSINATYVLNSIQAFVRTQKFKSGIIRAADMINRNQEASIPQIEQLWYELLRTREISFEPGLRLVEYEKVLDYFENHSTEFMTGVKELNQNFITPARGEVILFIAPSGYGKSWWLVDLGHRALQVRKKVCHISLELSEEEIALRYYQAMLGLPKHRLRKSSITCFETEETIHGTIFKGFNQEDLYTDLSFKSEAIRDELWALTTKQGAKLENLVIKRFPMRSLTMRGLDAYLDNLQATGFDPDLTVLDYMGVTATDVTHHRLNLGRNYEEFRGIMVRRNQAGATAHQTNRPSATARNVRSHHISEDWSMVGTSDNILTFSQTEGEKRFKLARLYVNKARTERSGITVLISQNYEYGQFCRESVMMDNKIERYVDEFTGGEDDAEVTSDDDDS